MLGRRGLRRAFRIAAEPLRPLRSVRAKAPQRLLIAPQDIRTVDPTIASEIQDGYFAFGGKIVNAGALSPFEIEAPSKSWARALGGFGWLKHLRAADAQTSRANARAQDFDGASISNGDKAPAFTIFPPKAK